MGSEDRLRAYSEAGEEFLDAARGRVVELIKELTRAGASTQSQAKEQVDEVFEVGRRGTDLILEVIRREVASQLGALGIATKADLKDLEHRLTRNAAAARVAQPRAAKAAPKSTASKSAAAKSTPTKSAAAKTTAAKATRQATKAAPVKAARPSSAASEPRRAGRTAAPRA